MRGFLWQRRLGLAVLLLFPSPREGSGQDAVSEGTPTWAEDVAAILYDNCAGCHRPGSVAPFPLLEWEDARRRAARIAEVTGSGQMPPWPPDREKTAFVGERGLERNEIELLLAWAEAGAPAGDLDSAPQPPVFVEGWELGPPDLVLEMPRPFAVPASGPDLFRNFLVPLDIEPGTRVAAFQFRPGNPRVVHHAAVLADASGTARQREALDPAPGYADMVGGGPPGGHFVGWTPGKGVTRLPEGMPWEVPPDSDLVVQLHLLPSGRPESVQAQVGLYFTDEPVRAHPATLHLLHTETDLEPGQTELAVTDELTLPVAVEALSIYPHAHYLGRSVEVEATAPDGSTRTLLSIPRWHFHWQDEYRYPEPVPLAAGTRLRLEIVYDNSAANPHNPSSPPRRVLWGPKSYDEMGDVWIQVVPRDEADREELVRAVNRHEDERYLKGYAMRARVDPEDGDAWTRLGIGHVQTGRYEEGIADFERALELMPLSWEIAYNLGVASAALGRPEEAAAHYRAALELSPDDSRTHNALAGLLLAGGDAAGAVEHYRKALESRPRHVPLLANLGVALQRTGEPEEAERTFRRALALDPADRSTLLNYGALLLATGRIGEAVVRFEEAVAADPDHLPARHNLARALVGQGRFADAEGVLLEAIDVRPGRADSYYYLALVRAQEGRLEAAVEAAESALELDPGLDAARLDLALFLGYADRGAEALELLDPLRGRGGGLAAEVEYRRGTILQLLGRVEEARQALEAALALDPQHGEARKVLEGLR